LVGDSRNAERRPVTLIEMQMRICECAGVDGLRGLAKDISQLSHGCTLPLRCAGFIPLLTAIDDADDEQHHRNFDEDAHHGG
jgi:hypothetical protein